MIKKVEELMPMSLSLDTDEINEEAVDIDNNIDDNNSQAEVNSQSNNRNHQPRIENDEVSYSNNYFMPAFILFGPYLEKKYDVAVCELLSVDTAAIDRKAKFNKRKRNEEFQEETVVKIKDEYPGREIEEKQIILQEKSQAMLDYQQRFDMASKLHSLAPEDKKNEYFVLMDGILKEIVNSNLKPTSSTVLPPTISLSKSSSSSSSSSSYK